MWSTETKKKLASELSTQLDSNTFLEPQKYFNNEITTKNTPSTTYSSLKTGLMFFNNKEIKSDLCRDFVKGISFKNNESNLPISHKDRKIYNMSDLIESELPETIVIPYQNTQTSLAIIKSYTWNEILFSNPSEAIKMIKNKFRIK